MIGIYGVLSTKKSKVKKHYSAVYRSKVVHLRCKSGLFVMQKASTLKAKPYFLGPKRGLNVNES
jgi:hypothetical protein